MSFEVLLHHQAAKFFRKLPLEEQNRVKIRLNELRSPFKIPSGSSKEERVFIERGLVNTEFCLQFKKIRH